MTERAEIMLREEANKLSVKDLGECLFEMEKEQYEEKPVSIDTFLDDSDFLKPMLEDSVYPFWREKLREIYPTPFHSPYYEIIAHLPIGAGKTFVSNASILYEIYRLLCLRDPQNYYKIRPSGTQIVFTLFSASKTLAADVNWASLESLIDGAPWFRRNCPLPTGKKLSQSDPTVDLPKNIGVALGSAVVHAIGKAVFGGSLDEANFQKVKSEQALQSYLTILRRMESRFLTMGGFIPGKLWLLSSPKFSTDFLSTRVEQTQSSKSTLTISNVPIWEVNKGSEKALYSGKTFRVFVGSENKDPAIVEGVILGVDPELIYDVPIEYLASFEKDLISSIKDIIGRSTSLAINLFKHVSRLVRVCTIPHRYTAETIELDFMTPDETIVKYSHLDYFRKPMHPNSWRFIHVDLGLTNDKAGIAAVYCTFEKELLYKKETEVKYKTEKRFWVDWVLSIRCKPDQEIPIYKIKDWLVFLKKIGYPIKVITCDQYQCVTGDTLVLTEEGHKRIDLIGKGERVWTRKGWKMVKNLFVYEEAPVVEVETKRGYILKGTPKHKIWVEGKGYKKLEDLQIGEELGHVPFGVSSGRYQSVNLVLRRFGRAVGREFNVLNESLAELLGMWHGDGYWKWDGIYLSCGSEEEYSEAKERIERVLGSEVGGYGEGTSWVVTVNDTILVKSLMELGFGGKAREKRIPGVILESPNSVVAAYLRGLFSTDGHVSDVVGCEGQVSLSTFSEVTVRVVQILLKDRFGIGSTISKIKCLKSKGNYKDGDGWRLALNGSRRGFFEQIGFIYTRKQAILGRFLHVPGRSVKERVKLKRVGVIQRVYDLEVEEEHCYYSNGLLSHNSRDLRQQLALAGFQVGHVSVDGEGGRIAYLTLKGLIYADHFLAPKHNLLMKEARELRDDGMCVDHPPHGSKDVMDGVAGATWSCLNSDRPVNQFGVTEAVQTQSVKALLNRGFAEQMREKMEKRFNPFGH